MKRIVPIALAVVLAASCRPVPSGTVAETAAVKHSNDAGSVEFKLAADKALVQEAEAIHFYAFMRDVHLNGEEFLNCEIAQDTSRGRHQGGRYSATLGPVEFTNGKILVNYRYAETRKLEISLSGDTAVMSCPYTTSSEPVLVLQFGYSPEKRGFLYKDDSLDSILIRIPQPRMQLDK